MASYFVGAVFNPSSFGHQRIDSFRKRFDHRFQWLPQVYLPLTPVVKLNHLQVGRLVQEIKDEASSYFLGQDYVPSIKLIGPEVGTKKRESIVYYRPELGDDLFYLQEGLGAIFKGCINYSFDSTLIKKGQVVLGRSIYPDMLETIFQTARQELPMSFSIPVKEIVIFRRIQRAWILEDLLESFISLNACVSSHL